MKSKLLCLAFVVGVLTFCGSTFAHHGSAAYSNAVAVMKDATVTKFTWNNPHCIVMFDVKDEKGNIEKWTAELGALGMLARSGWRRDTLKPGDEITAIGNPAKDGKPVMHLTKIVFANGQELSSAL